MTPPIGIDRETPAKLYLQVMDVVRRNVASGEWSPGTRIPPEDALCRLFGVSKITVRQAIGKLAAEGLLVRQQGRGTYVQAGAGGAGFTMRTRLAEEFSGKGVEHTVRLVERRPAGGADPETRAFEASPGHSLLFVRRVREAGGAPVLIEDSVVPEDVCPELATAPLDNASLFALLQAGPAGRVSRAVETFEVGHLSSAEARILKARPGAPALIAYRRLFGAGGRPIACTRFVSRAGRYKFQIEFERV
jgi:GntR family transcriptional regulator